MKILLIVPAKEKYIKPTNRQTHNMACGILGALTPRNHDVEIIDEQAGQTINYNDDVDLVGITMMTNQAYNGYKIADKFKERGVKVVLGGIHASILPEEAINHADSVVIGEAEGIWEELLKDFKENKLNKFYKNKNLVNMADIPHLRRELYNGNKTTFNVASIQATRGCPYTCDFCSCNMFFGNKFRTRPVENVIDEIKSIPNKNLFFVDDNIVGNPKYAEELFNKMIPLNKIWFGQASLSIAANKKLIDLAYKSGCRGLYVGIESINADNLKETGAFAKRVAMDENLLLEKIRIIQEPGILVMSAIIFGFDHDERDCFKKTVEFLVK